MEQCLNLIKLKVEKTISTSVRSMQSDEKHNHPPVRFIVDSCPFCQKHGNVFATMSSGEQVS